jgi:hypothetical protein
MLLAITKQWCSIPWRLVTNASVFPTVPPDSITCFMSIEHIYITEHKEAVSPKNCFMSLFLHVEY